ncbi:MAG: hydantoinase B/oxoprolinase family protein, partial [Pseudomonadota bacterium]|nr:hydantoinase B/oxoprolinase family protein [Pseudomonadota bacterium]
MANAIKKISVQRGYDISLYTLNCFGGAGGQHACLVADSLGIKRILVHPHAGVLSAYGMGLADRVASRERAVERPLDPALIPVLEATVSELEADGDTEMTAQGEDPGALQHRRRLRLRYAGSDTALLVGFGKPDTLREVFEQQHRMRFGFISPEKPLIVESIEVETVSPAKPPAVQHAVGRKTATRPAAVCRCYLDGAWQETPLHQRSELPPETPLPGPAVILDPTATTVVEPGWQAKLAAAGDLVLERYLPLPERKAIGTDVDPVMLEIFNNLFMSIAEQMGLVLENTAASVNIKERLDFSCAIFDASGALVANAPHIPVHLGSMSESIRTVIRDNRGNMAPGDAFILNDPYNGGTHLPDVTVVKPVFDEAGREVLFYTAARGHHADIGGKTPGSMPPDSTSVEEEGVLIDNFKLVDRGRFREQAMRKLLAGGRWPARNIDMNIADFKAQLAACEKGVQELMQMVLHFGLDVVQAYMRHVQDNAEASVQRLLGALHDGAFSYVMDDGSQICVEITIHHRDDPDRRRTRIDFSGTSPQHPGNFNAPTAIVRAAVLYVLRCLVDDNIPLNEGCLKPVEIVIPEGSMINPEYPAAVVAGNVETSQYIVDTLLGALGAAAGSQGTMNNFTWGNKQNQYYETLCGGAGATPGHDGADAVHTHMTNSRLTDPEVLEWRF